MSIKERWKKLKYWQKAGLIAVIINLLLLYGPIYNKFNPRKDEIGFSMDLLKSILYSPWLYGIFLDFSGSNFILQRINLAFFYFLIGAAFGQLYFELKNPAPLFDRSRIKGRILSLLILLGYLVATAFDYFIGLFY